MEILRKLITDKLSTAVQEILAVVETTISGYDSEVLLLKHELSQHKRQLDSILLPEVKLIRIDGNVGNTVPHKEEHEGHFISGDISGPHVPCPTTEGPSREDPDSDEPGDLSFMDSAAQDEDDEDEDTIPPPRAGLIVTEGNIESTKESHDEVTEENKDQPADLSFMDSAAQDEDDEDEDTIRPPRVHETEGNINKESTKEATLENVGDPRVTPNSREQKVRKRPGRPRKNDPETHRDVTRRSKREVRKPSRPEVTDAEDDEDEEEPKVKLRRKSRVSLKCLTCGLRFNFKSILTKHCLKLHVDGPEATCGVCGERPDPPEDLRRHLEAHNKLCRCETCGRYFLTKRGLEQHSVTCQTGRRAPPKDTTGSFQCDRCPRSFSFRSELHTHYITHSGETPYRCEVCGKGLSTFPSYARHKLKHSGQRNYSCKECGKTFSCEFYMKRHQKTHGVREKPHLCEICSKAFLTKTELKVHQARMHGEAPAVVCPVCGKTLRGALGSHMKIHNQERPFSCSECGATFRTNSALKNHLDIHLQRKRFSCSVCQYKCSRKEHLKVHMSTHTGLKPYRCPECDQGFTQSHCLKSHMRSHHTDL